MRMKMKWLFFAALFLPAAGRAYCADVPGGPYTDARNRALLEDFEARRRALFDDGPQAEAVMEKAVAFLKTLPAGDQWEAAGNVLVFMNGTLRYAPDQPIERGPHEWTSRQALAYGTYNGCVEAGRVFFRLFRGAYPEHKARAIGSFNSAAPAGGHALVEVEGKDGTARLVDTSSFARLPRNLLRNGAREELTEKDLARPVDFSPEHRGVIVQFDQDCDMFAEKTKDGYRAVRYPYSRIFDAAPLGEERFTSLAGLNSYLSGYGRADVSLEGLLKLGIVLDYADKERTSFLYGKKQDKLVIFACDTAVSEKTGDEDTGLEAKARKEYAAGKKVSTCVRD